MNRLWSLIRNLVLILASTLAACGSEEPQDLELLGDPKGDPAPTDPEEADRLSKLQLVRVVDPDTGDAVEFGVGELENMIFEAGICGPGCPWPPVTCEEQGGLCWAQLSLCQAKLLLSAALPQTGELVLPLSDNYDDRFPADPDFVVIPMQTQGANVALAMQAINDAQSAASAVQFYINDLFNGIYEIEIDGQLENCLNVQPSLESATALFADAYHTAKEAYDIAVEASLAVSDAQLGSTPSAEEALARVFSGPALSRAAAAHLLVGGTPGIFGDTRWTFCTERLEPDVVAAISVFRDAATDPVVLSDESYDTDSILNGTGTAIPNGSVKQRLSNYYGQDVPATIQEHFKLELPAFERARAYLKDEINTFGRSLKAELPNRVTPSGDPSPYPRFAATASRPLDATPTLFGAVGRFLGQAELWGSPVWPNYFRSYLSYAPPFESQMPEAHFIDVVHSHATNWLTKQDQVPESFRGQAMAPLALIVSSKERPGRLIFDGAYVDAHGFSPTDGLLLGIGDDALRCAVQGTIEGAGCELYPTTFADTSGDPPNRARVISLEWTYTPAQGFDEVASGALFDERPAGRYYLLRPKRPELGVVPGNYESILALTLGGTGDPSQWSYPITPELDRRVDEILAPSRKWCAVPRMSCSGGLFDDRIPLDDELASDQDGVESSWRHYLTLAKEAATRADELGKEYINAGLDQSLRVENVEVRVEQQRERADDEIAKLQNICGTAVDPRKLLDYLGGGDFVDAVLGGSCDDDSDCLSAGTYECMSGQCVVNLARLAKANQHDPDMLRIAQCLSDSDFEPFVSLGTEPICLWHHASNPNLICEGAAAGVCPKFKGNAGTCEQALQGHPEGVAVRETTPLMFFDSTGDDRDPTDQCAELARARNGEPFDMAKLSARRWWDPALMRIQTDRLNYRAQPLNFGAILVDGGVFAETGTPEGGPSGHWPCGTLVNGQVVPPDGCTPSRSLWCNVIGECSTEANRAVFNLMMFRAVAAAKFLTLGLHPQHVNGAEFWAPLNGEVTLTQAYINHLKEIRCEGQGAGVCPAIPAGGHRVFETYLNTALTETNWGRGFTYENGNTSGPGLAFQSTWHLFESMYGAAAYGSSVNYTPNQKLALLIAKLKGQAVPNIGAYFYPASINGASYGTWHFGNTSFGANGTYGSMALTDRELLDGFELICRLSQPDGSVTLDEPPVVRSIDDLGRVSTYMQLMANEIRSRASLSVFSNVPRIAFDGLRQESASGAYPKFGGKYGETLAQLRAALIKIRAAGVPLANEVQQFGYDVEHLKILLQKHAVSADLAALKLTATMTEQLLGCGSSIFGSVLANNVAGYLGTLFSCVNSIAQINFAAGIAELQGREAELDSDLAVADFGSRFATRATNLQTLSFELAEAQEAFDAGLAEIEVLRNDARSSLARALYLTSFQAEHQAEVTSVIGNLFDGKQRRYMEALGNARRMAFMAKRAIEQRLGVRLADMTDHLPLVEAPATWESSVCTFTGLSFDTLKEASPNAASSFANGFIQDYVTRLENTIESYRLENNFHEGTDTAVISLRDDLLNVRAECDTPVGNLLYHAGQLDALLSPGWAIEGCEPQIVDGEEVPGLDCVAIDRLPNGPLPVLSQAGGYELEFGSGTPALVQSMDLEAGRYRLSWYTADAPETGGATAELIESDVPVTIVQTGGEEPTPDGWHREFRVFTVASDAEVRIGFGPPSVPPNSIRVAAPLLEELPDINMEFALTPFSNTGDTLTQSLPTCEDTSGEMFRAQNWVRRCVMLCADGFSSDCSGAQAQSYCFQEASFSINQRDIQFGKVMNFSGFARGNFNYRIENIGLNFVGSGTRDCSDSDLPSTCLSTANIPYTIEHNGPFFVRNHLGADVESLVFDGRIEHARGLAAERYLTNPLSSADSDLINQYLRTELQGRPLDGSFVIRVWEDPGVNFDGIDDIQVVLKYRYWTRFD